jgi:hypothetical protein
MNIQEGQHINKDLKSILQELIREEFRQFKQDLSEKKDVAREVPQKTILGTYTPDALLKPCQAAPILNISTKTLGRWRKKGFIPSTLIKGQHSYRYEDVQSIIENQPSLEHSIEKNSEKKSSSGKKRLLENILN